MPRSLRVSIIPSATATRTTPVVVVTSIDCVDMGDDAAIWLDQALDKRGLRLVRAANEAKRYIHAFPLWFSSSPSMKDHILVCGHSYPCTASLF